MFYPESKLMQERAETTMVGRYKVPIKKYHYPTIIAFSSGDLGRQERGLYCFWTATFKRKYFGKDRIFGRALSVLSPGDRFDRMKREMRSDPDLKDRKVYEEMYVCMLQRGDNIKYIRPSTPKEVRLWMESHKSDARYATGLKWK